MSDPAAHAAVLAAVITGSVAGVAIVANVITTWLALHHQRKAEDKRHQHERDMRLLDSALHASVDFLAAADRTTHARQAVDTATISLMGAKSSGNQQTYQHFREQLEEAREHAYAATADAENAYAAVRMLIPSVADQAHSYLDLCVNADAHPDKGKDERQRMRQMVEKTIRRALGGDLPGNWISNEPVPGEQRSRWSRRRKIPPVSSTVAARSPQQTSPPPE